MCEQEIDGSALLTALVIRYKTQHDETVGASIISQLNPFVSNLSAKLESKSFGMARKEDLEGVGAEEIVRCIIKYHVDSGPFLQYAMRAVRGAMLHYIRDKTLAVKVPGSSKEAMYTVNRFIQNYKRVYGAEPSLGEIAKGLSYSFKRVEDAVSVTAYIRLAKNLEDCEDSIVADIDGNDPSKFYISNDEGKELVSEVVKFRNSGYSAEDFMATYGLSSDEAKRLVEIIDIHFLDQLSIPEGVDLMSFIGAIL